MTAHVRTQIRERLATQLGATVTSASIRSGQIFPLAPEMLPALLVLTGAERVAAASIGSPPMLTRDLEVNLVALVAAEDGHEDALDQIAAEVEQAIATDRTLGGLVREFQLSSLRPAFDTDASLPVGRLEIVYSTNYRAIEGAPQTPL